jgi:hypothetical protein
MLIKIKVTIEEIKKGAEKMKVNPVSFSGINFKGQTQAPKKDEAKPTEEQKDSFTRTDEKQNNKKPNFLEELEDSEFMVGGGF